MVPEYLNVLDPQDTRYINVREELEAFLVDKYCEKYGEDIKNVDFEILVRSLNRSLENCLTPKACKRTLVVSSA
jgi:hypothetical protein